jgi:hypothetical protein
MQYDKTQHAPLHYIIIGVAALMLGMAWFNQGEPAAAVLLVAVAAVLVLVAFMCGSLTVRDEGDRLAVRFGPIPAFGTRIRYADITSVEPDRTAIIDGWGIHWVPWRGMTYNLWGFGCVKLTVGKRVVRVGSGDVENLVAFLNTKVQKTSDRGH